MIFGQCLRFDEQLEWSMGSCGVSEALGEAALTPWASYASAVASASVKSLVKSAVACLGVGAVSRSGQICMAGPLNEPW